MSWIEKIRQKPHEEKIKIIWTTVVICGIVLVAVWITTSQMGKTGDRDTKLFQTVGRGLKDIREQYRK